tara:strand:+ start:8323 stop:8817 length:495 start_codon:yes stop_codon:yes gene_type:complete
MDNQLQLQIIKDIIFLIKDDIGITYNSSRYEHVFNLIFKTYMIEIALDFESTDISVFVYQGTDCNSVHLSGGDPGVSDLIDLLRDRFEINNTKYLEGFTNEVGVYCGKEDNDEYLTKRLSNLIETEQFEKAEELKTKMRDIEKKKNTKTEGKKPVKKVDKNKND